MTLHLKTKRAFKEAKETYKKDTPNLCWEDYMWELFKEETCYIVEQKCFISYDRAIELGFIITSKQT